MRVLVTGVAGFFGSHLAARLLSAGHSVVGVDVLHPDDASRLEGIQKEIDYRWQSLQAPLYFTPDAVVHCAATTDVRMAATDALNAVQVNVAGTAALLSHLTTKYAIGPLRTHFIQVSTHSVYGRPPSGGTFREDMPCHPTNLYGATKLAQEALARAAGTTWGMPVTVLRMSLMYGEQERAGALVSSFIRRALAGGVIRLDGGGNQTRDFNYVENAVDAVMLAMGNERAAGETFNIPGGIDISVRDLAEKAIALAGSGSVEDGPAREGEEGSLRLDGCKAQTLLGYAPKVGFGEGFRRTFESLKR